MILFDFKFVIFSLVFINQINCFVPKRLYAFVVGIVDNSFKNRLGFYSNSIVHEEIIQRGIARSVTRYFYDKENGPKRIDLSKLNTDYQNIKNIYSDYYGRAFCIVDIERIISGEFERDVASVDFDAETKDLASAHFDAEKLNESNQRVLKYLNIIHNFLKLKDYRKAREYSGKILHTIHDFYSHSNWVEMGNTKINKEIGSKNFSTVPLVDEKDKETCLSNCTITEIECNRIINGLVSLIRTLGVRTSLVKCPIKFYSCKGNVIILTKRPEFRDNKRLTFSLFFLVLIVILRPVCLEWEFEPN